MKTEKSKKAKNSPRHAGKSLEVEGKPYATCSMFGGENKRAGGQGLKESGAAAKGKSASI